MKKLTHVAAGLILASSGIFATTASAEVSYNIGWASEYYYRGILQNDSSGSAGIDWEDSGFYAGAWTADVGDGLEVDGFFGYSIEIGSGFTAGVGFTGYYYTGEFDDTYEEVNLKLGYETSALPVSFALEYSVGEWDGFGAEADYDFLAVTATHENGIYAKYGTFGDEFDGDYIELGWGTTISEIDFGVAAIFNSDELSDQLDSNGGPTEGEAFVFSIGKSF